jgi:arsenate reductase (thioredoxin)
MDLERLILIICTGNSCLSQMAEELFRQFHGDRYEVQSAGTEPDPEVNALTVRVMAELGVDIKGKRPRGLAEMLRQRRVHHLLIVSEDAEVQVPRTVPGALSRTLMPFDDPASLAGSRQNVLQEFRRVRDQMAKTLRTWTPQIFEPDRSDESVDQHLARYDQLLIDHFQFGSSAGGAAFCALELLRLRDGRTAVIATELKDNPGPSITEGFEVLASVVCHEFAIDPHKLVWIEHYGYASAFKLANPRHYDLVNFVARNLTDGNVLISQPEWSRMDEDAWRALGLAPRQPVNYSL